MFYILYILIMEIKCLFRSINFNRRDIFKAYGQNPQDSANS